MRCFINISFREKGAPLHKCVVYRQEVERCRINIGAKIINALQKKNLAIDVLS